MGYEAKVILDSVSPDGVRLTTIAATFPRFILAEMNTHRMFSRNTASSRAIPLSKMIEAVEQNPFIPEKFYKNCAGMQAYEELSLEESKKARANWIKKIEAGLDMARIDMELRVHKQQANRGLEPFSWTTQLITATEWDNFFKLRCHPDAQPEMQKIACVIRDAREASTPKMLNYGEWHTPFFDVQVDDPHSPYFTTAHPSGYIEVFKSVSVARCARVSYLTHEGKRDIEKDLELFERLKTSGHWSPFEHVATPYIPQDANDYSGNFFHWHQYRKDFRGEDGVS